MNRVLRLIGAFVVCVLATLFLVPRFVDWSHYRGLFEEEASRLLGREVRVGGEVILRLLPTPYVRFDTVRVFNSGQAAGQPVFKADGFTLRLAVAPLFRGVVEANQIELTRPVLTLVVDEQGGGNWSGIGPRPGYGFVPRSVALNDVRIEQGVILFRNLSGDELGRFDIPSADLAAPALEGPYKLQAMLAAAGGAREVRLSTAAPEADGSVRFKGTVRTNDTGASYTLDGQLVDLKGRTRITGEVTAVLPLQLAGAIIGGGSSPRSASASPDPARGSSTFDLRAAFKVDTKTLEINGLSMSFDSGGHPQFVTGDTRFDWGQGRGARIQLQSQWLDLDRISGSDGGGTPLGLLTRFLTGLDDLMPARGRTNASIALEQATLGGELVSGLRLSLQKDADGLNLSELRAALPGGTRLDAGGTLKRQAAELSFDGDLTLRGASLSRFLAWAAKGHALPEVQDGGFGVRGRATFAPGSFSAREMTLQLAGNNLTGEVGWTWSDQRRLSLLIEGSEIDLSPFLDSRSVFSVVQEALLSQPATGHAAAPSSARDGATSASRAPLEAVVRIRAGRLIAGHARLRDVVADIAIDRDSLTMPAIRFASEDDDLTAELHGSVTKLSSGAPKGAISGHIAAGRDGIRHLAEMLELPESWRPSVRRAEALAPMRLAGTLALGNRGASLFDLAVDGRLADSALSARLLLDDVRSSWREQRIDVTASLENAQASPLAAQVLPEGLAASVETGVRTPARLSLKVVGMPAKGVASLLTIDAAGISGQFQGRASVSGNRIAGLDGLTRFAADDLGHVISISGLGRRPSLAGVPVRMTLATNLKDQRLQLDIMKLTLGTTKVEGNLVLAMGGARPRLDGILATGEVNLPLVLSAVTGPHPQSNDAARADERARSIWPDHAIDLGAFAAVDVGLRLQTPRVKLMQSFAVANASAEVTAANGKITLAMREAQALGGAVSGELVIERAVSGLNVRAQGRLANGLLEAAAPGESPVAKGRMSIDVELSGAGLSARSIVVGMRGKGVVVLGDAQLNRMSPGAITAAAVAALAVPSENLASELEKQLQEGLSRGALALGPRRIGFAIADGVVKIEPIELSVAEGRVVGTTAMELDSMRFDSDWRIEPKPSGRVVRGRGKLPGVTMLYVGSLLQLDSVEPKMQFDALARELNVRRMEKYVDELERLRHQDEERVRQEVERQRNLELERQRLEDERQKMLLRRGESADPQQPVVGTQTPSSSTAAPISSQSEQPARSAQPLGAGAGAGSRGRPSPFALPDLMRDLGDRSN